MTGQDNHMSKKKDFKIRPKITGGANLSSHHQGSKKKKWQVTGQLVLHNLLQRMNKEILTFMSRWVKCKSNVLSIGSYKRREIWDRGT